MNRSDDNNTGHSGESNNSYINNQVSPSGLFFRRQRACPLSGENSPKIDYKDPKLLTKFLSEGGRILPSRITSVSAKKQRQLKIAIKRARNIALLPFTTHQ